MMRAGSAAMTRCGYAAASDGDVPDPVGEDKPCADFGMSAVTS